MTGKIENEDFIKRAKATWRSMRGYHPAHGPVVTRLFMTWDADIYFGRKMPSIPGCSAHDGIDTVRFTFEACGWNDGDAGKDYEWWNVIANGIIIDMVWYDRDDRRAARF